MFLRSILMIIVLGTTFFFGASTLNAEEQTTIKELDSDVFVEVFDDGRLKPIKDFNEFTEYELDIILSEIGYSDTFLLRQPIERKQHLISLGGKLVDADIKLTEEYMSKNGETYEVTPYNKSEVREQQIQDLLDLNVPLEEINNYNLVDSGISLMSCAPPPGMGDGFCQDGDWTGMLMILKTGETTSSFKYNMMLDFSWQGTTNTNFGDSAGIFWGTNGQPIANTEQLRFSTIYPDGNQNTSTHGADVSSIFGVKANFFLAPVDSNIMAQAGLLEQEVYVSKSLRGENLAVSAAYAHPWSPAGTITIGSGGITFSFGTNLGNKWDWQANFTPN